MYERDLSTGVGRSRPSTVALAYRLASGAVRGSRTFKCRHLVTTSDANENHSVMASAFWDDSSVDKPILGRWFHTNEGRGSRIAPRMDGDGKPSESPRQ